MRRPATRAGWVAAALALSACDASLCVDASASGPLGDFARLAVGEYNNHEQVSMQIEDGMAESQRQPHRHYQLRPTSAPRAGESALLITALSGDAIDRPDGLRWRLLGTLSAQPNEAEAIRMTLHRLSESGEDRADSSLGSLSLSAEDLIALPGCTLVWRQGPAGYDGQTSANCQLFSERFERSVIAANRYRLDAEGLRVRERFSSGDGEALWEAPEALHRRARYYTGWIRMRRSQIDPTVTDDDDMVVNSGLRLHNEGQILPLLDAGQPTGYAVQLARLSYRSKPPIPILKLGIIERASGHTVAYSWSSPDAGRIGLNLRWILSGMTAESAP